MKSSIVPVCIIAIAVMGVLDVHAAAPLLDPAEAPISEISFADFAGDSKPDMVVRDFATGNLSVYVNQGDHFAATPSWVGLGRSAPDGVNWDTLYADMNGDGKADSIDRSRGDGSLCIHFNVGNDFAASAPCYGAALGHSSPRWKTFLGRIDGDTLADRIDIDQSTGTIYVYRNNGAGFDSTPLFSPQTVAVPAYPPSGWQQFLADCDNDGKADLINFNQVDGTLYCHVNQGSSFAPVTGLIFPSTVDIYEREFLLVDFNGDGVADVVSHDLRTGDITVLPVFRNSAGEILTGHTAVLRDRSPPYTRSNAQQPLPQDSSRSLSTLMWYDNDHEPNPQRPAANGWFSLYPGAPGAMSSSADPEQPYRADTPILGLYDSSSVATIRQHAYWLRAVGADTFIVDLTNCAPNSPVPQPPGSSESYCDGIRGATSTMLATLADIRDFTPPRMIMAMRISHENFTEATQSADDIYAIYQAHPQQWYTYDDGSADKFKPLLLVLVDFNDPWKTAPQWVDPQHRFNIRYTNGYLDFLGFTSVDAPEYSHITNELPYWPFVENTKSPTRTGYYRSVSRQMPTDTSQSEASIAWSGVWLDGLNHQDWDGQQDVTSGKITLERYADPLYAKPPRNLAFGRFNYMQAWLKQPQEGISTNDSTYIEPSTFTGWAVYDKAAKTIFDLKKQRERPPGKPYVTYYNASTGKLAFQSANWPTQYCTSANAQCSEGNWHYVDVRSICPLQSAGGSSFYLLTRNPFGTSDPVMVSGTQGTLPPSCI